MDWVRIRSSRVQFWPFCDTWWNVKVDHPVPSVVALSWRHWTPLRRCGCRSGNMKKTEHVPSTGRPSSRDQRPAISPRTALKPPLSYYRRLLHLPCLGTSASPSYQPKLLSASCFTPAPRETHTLMCGSFCIYLPFLFTLSSLCSSCCRVTAPNSLQTLTYRGPSGYLRGQQLALWTLTAGNAPLNLVHIEVLVLLSCLKKPCKV